MSMTAEEFYKNTLGKQFEMDGVPKSDPVQCADYFKKACQQMLGYCWATGGDGYVDNWWYTRMAHANEFVFISDYTKLQNGDFVLWRNSARGDTPYPLSHIAMYHNGHMVGQNQPNKYVTEKVVDQSVWRRMLGAFRFKAWDVAVTPEISRKGNDLEQINAQGTAASTRKIATSFHVYAKNGTTPKMMLKKSMYEGAQIYALQIKIDENTQIVTSFFPATEWLCLMHSACMLANGWIIDAGDIFTLSPATSTTLGGVKIGSNISVAGDGTIYTTIDSTPTSSSTNAVSSGEGCI